MATTRAKTTLSPDAKHVRALDALIAAVPTWPSGLPQLHTNAILHHLRHARRLLVGKK